MYKPASATRRRFMSGLAATFGISRLSPFGFTMQERRQVQEFTDAARTDLQ